MFIACKDRIEYVNLDYVQSVNVNKNELTKRYKVIAVMADGHSLLLGTFDTEQEAKAYAVFFLNRNM